MIKKIITCVATMLINTSFAITLNDQTEGEQFYNYIKATMPISHDFIANDYINHLGYRLVSYSNEPSKNFHFFIVNEDQINAFAGPGGYIGMYAGLISITASESELASVMAHETAHVTQHHLARGQDKMNQTLLPSIAAMAAAIATGQPSLAIGGITAISAGNAQYAINTTRGYEKEADATGINILAKAGFDPYDMSNFFEKMQEQSRYDGSAPPILLTHPVTAERIAAALNRASFFPKNHYTSSASYFLVRARIQADLSTDRQSFFENSQSQANNNPDNPYAQYQYAISLSYTNHIHHAEKILSTLSQRHPQQIIYPYTQAEIYIKQKQYTKAIAILEKNYEYNEDYKPLVLLLAHAYNLNQESGKATRLLDKYQVDYVNDASFWVIFSTAQADSGNLVYAYLYRAKAYALHGDKKNSEIQLKMAQRQNNQSPYTTQLIEASLAQLASK